MTELEQLRQDLDRLRADHEQLAQAHEDLLEGLTAAGHLGAVEESARVMTTAAELQAQHDEWIERRRARRAALPAGARMS